MSAEGVPKVAWYDPTEEWSARALSAEQEKAKGNGSDEGVEGQSVGDRKDAVIPIRKVYLSDIKWSDLTEYLKSPERYESAFPLPARKRMVQDKIAGNLLEIKKKIRKAGNKMDWAHNTDYTLRLSTLHRNYRHDEEMREFDTMIAQEMVLPLLSGGRSVEAIAAQLQELGEAELGRTLEYLRIARNGHFLSLRIIRAAFQSRKYSNFFLSTYLARIIQRLGQVVEEEPYNFRKIVDSKNYRTRRVLTAISRMLCDIAEGDSIFKEERFILNNQAFYRLVAGSDEPLLLRLIAAAIEGKIWVGTLNADGEMMSLPESMSLKAIGETTVLKAITRLARTHLYYENAKELLLQLNEITDEKSGFAADVFARVLARLDRISVGTQREEFARVLHHMQHLGIKPHLPVYNVLLRKAATDSDSEAMVYYYNQMLDAGFRPDAITFLQMVRYHSNLGNYEAISKTINAAKRTYGLLPACIGQYFIREALKKAMSYRDPTLIFLHLSKSYLRDFDPSILSHLGLLPDMKQTTPRAHPTEAVIFVMVRDYLRSHRYSREAVSLVLNRFLSLRHHLLSSTREKDRRADAAIVCALTIGLSYHPDLFHHAVRFTGEQMAEKHSYAARMWTFRQWEHLCRGFQRMGMYEHAESVIDMMLKRGIVAPAYIWKAFVRHYKEPDTFDMAAIGRIVAKLLASGRRPSEKILDELMELDQAALMDAVDGKPVLEYSRGEEAGEEEEDPAEYWEGYGDEKLFEEAWRTEMDEGIRPRAEERAYDESAVQEEE